MRVAMRAGFDRFSGYGNDAIDIALHMEKQGVEVTPMPSSILPGLPRKFLKLMERDPRGPKDVMLAFQPPQQLKPWELDKIKAKRVGYTMWERNPMTVHDFLGSGWMPYDISFEGWDRLAVTCPMNVDALAPFSRDVPVDVVPCGIEPDDWPVAKRDPQQPFKVLMIGMLNGRKNPFAMLEAWRDLQAEHPEFDGELVLHTLAPGLHPGICDGAYGKGVTLSQRPLSREQLVALYHDCDLLVSTSRGEGNNKPAMEFMATGGAVAATDWSGHQNWLSREFSYPLQGELVQARDTVQGVEEFEVDQKHLRGVLLWAWQERGDLANDGMKSANWIRQVAGWPQVTKQLIGTLEKACAT